MDYEKIKSATLDVYQKCEIKSFPIDCEDILQSYGMKVEKYSDQKPAKLKKCLTYSEDAFSLKNKVYYNDKRSIGRIRFSLAHEIGHVVLSHGTPRNEEHEKESDCFASYILAPRMAIHYAKCKNENDVAKLFKMTNEAAGYAFDDYRRWHRWIVYHKMNAFDKALYAHFYNEEQNCFVYNIKKCTYCNSSIYNSDEKICIKCKFPHYTYSSAICYDQDLIIAENQWLYKGI